MKLCNVVFQLLEIIGCLFSIYNCLLLWTTVLFSITEWGYGINSRKVQQTNLHFALITEPNWRQFHAHMVITNNQHNILLQLSSPLLHVSKYVGTILALKESWHKSKHQRHFWSISKKTIFILQYAGSDGAANTNFSSKNVQIFVKAHNKTLPMSVRPSCWDFKL